MAAQILAPFGDLAIEIHTMASMWRIVLRVAAALPATRAVATGSFNHAGGQQAWRGRYRSFAAAAAAPRSSEAPRAALMVIGDEVLAGQISDANGPWIAKLLHNRGVDMVALEWVPDDKRAICDAVLRLRERVGDRGFVFTSGGIGPTHDDITYESVAAAFGAELALHQPTVDRMAEHYSKRGVELNNARLRMALLPQDEGVEVLFTEGLWVPLVCINRTYVLPGIPRLFQQMIEAHVHRFKGPAAHEQALFTHLGEGDVALPLGSIASLHPAVRIGSYPNTDVIVGQEGAQDKPPAFRVRLQLESRNPAALAAAVAAVRQQIATFDLPGLA